MNLMHKKPNFIYWLIIQLLCFKFFNNSKKSPRLTIGQNYIAPVLIADPTCPTVACGGGGDTLPASKTHTLEQGNDMTLHYLRALLQRCCRPTETEIVQMLR